MKAMVLDRHAPIEQLPLRFVEIPKPSPQNNHLLLRVSVCGICHTDLDEAEGRLFPVKLPIVLGHQVVGTVADKGKNAVKYNLGDRVGITWLYSSCGSCNFCRSDTENLCNDAQFTGLDTDGGYAEYMLIHEDFAHAIPEKFSNELTAPLLCAGVIGFRTFKLARINEGDITGIFGFGASAHIVIQILKHSFPDNPVFVFTRSPEHKSLAISLGAAWTGPPQDNPPEKLNRAFDFTPAGQTVLNALNVMDKGARLVINATRKSTPVPQLDYAKHLWLEKEIKSAANVTRQDAEEFLPLAAQIPIQPEVEKFELKEANHALLALKNSRITGAGVLKISD